MSVSWGSEAEILTENEEQAKKIVEYIKDKDSIYDLDLFKSSIRFSSSGYGSFEFLFDDICEKFKFSIFCHERVLPYQGQGYGFFVVFCRLNVDEGRYVIPDDCKCKSYCNGFICDLSTIGKFKENIYYDSANQQDSEFVDSVQTLSIPSDWLSDSNNNLSQEIKDDLSSIIKRSEENEDEYASPISPRKFYDSNVYYLSDFINDCMEDDQDRVYEIFEGELENMCTWNSGISISLLDREDNEIEMDLVSESIDFDQMRLVYNK